MHFYVESTSACIQVTSSQSVQGLCPCLVNILPSYLVLGQKALKWVHSPSVHLPSCAHDLDLYQICDAYIRFLNHSLCASDALLH